MRTTALRGALAGACLMLVAGSARAGSEIKWAKSYQAALAEAKASHKLVMADFYTDW